jgi:hypothetical protein
MTEEADRYRRQAEECRDEAAKAVSPIDQDRWLRLADEFTNLALAKAANEEAQRKTSNRRPQPRGKS